MTTEAGRAPVLLATNLSTHAEYAARWARDAAAALGTGVVVAHAVDVEIGQPVVAALELAIPEAALEEVETRARRWYGSATGLDPAGVEAHIGPVAAVLEGAAKRHGASMLVMSRSEKGAVARFVVGSRVQQLATRPVCPLVVVHEEHSHADVGPVAVATDFSQANRPALEFACRFAAAIDRELVLVHCAHFAKLPIVGGLSPDIQQRVITWSEAATERLAGSLRETHPDVDIRHRVLNGPPAEAIAAYMRERNPSLMVLGQTGYGLKLADLLGSVPRKLLNLGAGNVAVVGSSEA